MASKKQEQSGSSHEGFIDKYQFLAAIVQSTEDAVIGEDLNGKVVSWNPAAEKMFGYTGQEAIGQPLVSLIWPVGREKDFDDILKQVKKGVRIERYETERKRKNGTTFNVSVTVSPVHDEKGKVIGLSAIDRDISYQQQSAQYARSLVTAGDKVEAVVEKEQPDLVLLDVLMPGKNGFETLADLKMNEKTKQVPVMMLSNLGQETDMKKGMELGAIGYLIKSDTPIAKVVEQIKEQLARGNSKE